MMRKKINKIEGGILGAVAILEILILLSAIPSDSFLTSQSENPGISIIENKKEKLDFGKIFVSLLAVKQIGSVSAQEDEGLNCCVAGAQTENGAALCQDITPMQYQNGECTGDFFPSKCSETSQCKIGTCVVDDGISCIVSPRITCETSANPDAEWVDKTPAEILQCRKGCCVISANTKFETQSQCGLDGGEFLASISNEAQCIAISQNLLKGACVASGRGCTFTTGLDCNQRRGSFFSGVLCTNPDLKEQLDITCNPTEKTMIQGDKVYWMDSCGNPANIYNAEKTNSQDSDYWAVVSAPGCSVYNSDGSINQNALETCGNCDRFLGTLAKQKDDARVNSRYGDFACKDLSCKIEVDLNDDGDTGDSGEKYTKKNGEKWCVYEGSVGNVTSGTGTLSSDTVGSEHWLGKCQNGNAEWEHSNYRDKVCQERTTTDSVTGNEFVTASLVPNQAPNCFNYNPLQDSEGNGNQESISKCDENPHCTVKKVDIDEKFSFSVCVPKYPLGFSEDSPAQSYCAIASAKCTVIYRKNEQSLNLFADEDDKWEIVINQNCGTGEFASKMNNLCVSLGDCGSYVNYAGKGTDNVEIGYKRGSESGRQPDFPVVFGWENYAQYSDESKFQSQEVTPIATTADENGDGDGIGGTGKVDIGSIEDASFLGDLMSDNAVEFILSLGGILNKPLIDNPTLNDISPNNALNVLGVGGLIYNQLAVRFFGNTLIPGGYYGAFGEAPATTVSSFAPYASVAMWAVIGAYAGAYLAKSLDITGPAATTLIVAGGTAGATISYYYAVEAVGAVGWTGVFALVVILVIVVSGFGETEEREVKFTCLPWQAPTGTTSEDCNKCNEGVLECTKYRCESLGQTCTLINQNTDDRFCESIAPDDIAPVITAGEIMPSENYSFENEQRGISVDISAKYSADGCMQEYSKINFTLNVDEFTQCKWDYQPAADFDSFQKFPSSGNSFKKQHNFTIEGLSLGMLEAFEITGDIISGLHGEVKLYVQCKDYYNNINPTPYIVNFCLTQGPDITPVQLDNSVVAIPENNLVLPHGTSQTPLTLYINEPAECKFDYANNDYELMANAFNCNTGATPDFLGRWKCETPADNPIKLTQETNSIHIKCKDQPWETDDTKRNVNIGDYAHTLKVTKTPLLVNSVSLSLKGSTVPLSQNIRGEIKGGGENFKVDLLASTSGGNQNGRAQCRYDFIESPLTYSGDFFFETFAASHRQKELNIQDGNYNISVICNDDLDSDGIGNVAERSGVFSLVVDSSPPNIVRAYHDGGKLKLITDEDAKCAYGTERSYCSQGNVENATSMTVGFSKEHSTSWNGGQTYYIKCKDVYDKESNGCARIIIPTLNSDF